MRALEPDALSDEERIQELSGLPGAGLVLTGNQYQTLAWFNPDKPEVSQWLTRNGLQAEAGKTAELTVDGHKLTMKLDPRDFGTEVV